MGNSDGSGVNIDLYKCTRMTITFIHFIKLFIRYCTNIDLVKVNRCCDFTYMYLFKDSDLGPYHLGSQCVFPDVSAMELQDGFHQATAHQQSNLHGLLLSCKSHDQKTE